MKLKLFVFFFIGIQSLVYAQYKNMLHQPYKNKVEAIDSLYRNTVNMGRVDSLSIKNYTREIEHFALKHQDKELALEAALLNAYSNCLLYSDQKPELIQNLISVAQKGEEEKVLHIEARATKAIANHYWLHNKYEKSFEWLLHLTKILKQIKPESFPNMASHLNFIGRCYYFFKDYKNALIYYEKSSKLPQTKFNVEAVLEAQNSVGLCYQKLGKLKQAKYYFLKVIEDTSIYQKPTWKGIAAGNLGYNYYLKKDYPKAIPLLREDLRNAINIKEPGLAAGAAIPLADIYIKQHQLDKAKQKIEEAKQYIFQSNQTDRLRKLYPVMSKWYAANNEGIKSSAYLDSTIIALNAYNQKYNSLKLLRASKKVEAKNKQLVIEKLNMEYKLKVSHRNYIILFIVLLFTGSVLAYWFRNKYLLREQEIKELKIERTQKALTQAKKQLLNLKEKINSEKEIVESLQQEIQTSHNQKLINKLKSKIIVTDEDWSKYQQLFNEAYPTYLNTLKNSSANITPSELRCLCLEKLELSNKEMGLLLGVSTNSVMVTKHRIRKKLGLKNQQELQNFVRKTG